MWVRRAYSVRVQRYTIMASFGLVAAALTAPAKQAAADAASASLEITVTGARSDKGVVRIALCPPAAGFPDCGDKAVRTATLPITKGTARVVWSGLQGGNYAVSVFHDANGNGKLDTFAGIPREGYGFSRNPPFRPRAPRWEEAVFPLPGESAAAIKLRNLF